VLAAVDSSIEPRHVDLARTFTNRFADEANVVPSH
jgi:NitT/TauT family transport system substrate-binding protein